MVSETKASQEAQPELRKSNALAYTATVSDTPSQADGGNAYASSVSVSPHKKLTKKAAKALEVEERRRQRLEKKARKEREAAENKGRRKKGEWKQDAIA